MTDSPRAHRSHNPARAAQKALLRSLRVTRRLVRKRGKKAGVAPGTLVHTGPKRVDRVGLRMIRYGPEYYEDREVTGADECFREADGWTVTWLNIDGLHDTSLLADVGLAAGLHPLILEDVVSVGQRPKQEEYPDHHYIVLRMLRYEPESNLVEEEQVSIIVGRNYVLSLQESPGDVWDPVRERLRVGKGLARSRGPDYLAYALMDAIVDAYFAVVETVGDRLARVEEDVLDRPTPATIADIHALKGELLLMRKAVWPLRDLFNALIRDESDFITDPSKVFLRDAYDHAVQVIDTVETMRDLTGGLIDLYLSSVSNRMNEIMKVLTLIATLFIPLTFIVGIYGMNFEFMPELHWRWAYPIVWLVMLLITGGLLIYFRRKSWL